ncbi:MAG: heme biosynthesis HemY N-terminal domain-containing protein [Hyphomicrobiaceae bacterium]
MLRLVLFLIGVAGLATGLAWLADRPGDLILTWQGYQVQTSLFRAVVLLSLLLGAAIVAWLIFRQVWRSPAVVGRFFTRRRQERGLDALSGGMIAVGAGDSDLATRFALQARRALPNEPLTHLLRAQVAQLTGDRTTSRRIFEAMLGSPDTEQLGLRGLFLAAEQAHEPIAARQFAERAFKLNPKLGWPAHALFELQCMASDWPGALQTLGVARKHSHVDRGTADRRRAVLLTAQAQELEDTSIDQAFALSSEAHNLAPDLIPAGAIAGRILASRGSTAKAAKVLEKTWKLAPHPDLATAYAFARLGDSPRDRLDRIQRLARSTPHSIEGPIAVATAAIDARDWDTARKALQPLLETQLTQRVCTLMARIEGEEHNDAGRVREWLARAVNAPRDPAWTADGIVSDRWAAISPVTGALDAFQWKVPVESVDKADQDLLAAKLEEFVALGARPETAIEAKPLNTFVDESDTAFAVPAKEREAPLDNSASGPPAKASARADSDTAAATSFETAKPNPARAHTNSERATGTSPAPHAAAFVKADTSPAKRAPSRTMTETPRMFVPQRAPDDPGPDDNEALGYQTAAAKRPL